MVGVWQHHSRNPITARNLPTTTPIFGIPPWVICSDLIANMLVGIASTVLTSQNVMICLAKKIFRLRIKCAHFEDLHFSLDS